MTEKQFKIIDKEFISYYGGDAYLISNGDCKFHVWENKEDAQKVCDKLNNLVDENKRFKYTLIEAIHNERTDMGCNSLKQLANRLGVEY